MKKNSFWGFHLIRISLVLMFITIVSVYAMSGVMARYAMTGATLDDTYIASFDVRAVFEKKSDVDVKADNGTNALMDSAAYYEFTILPNKTEVATEYGVKMTLTDENGTEVWPEGLTVTIKNSDGTQTLGTSASGVFEDYSGEDYLGKFLPGATDPVTYRLYFKAGYATVGGTYAMNIAVEVNQAQ